MEKFVRYNVKYNNEKKKLKNRSELAMLGCIVYEKYK
jgi:hypothetical protein